VRTGRRKGGSEKGARWGRRGRREDRREGVDSTGREKERVGAGRGIWGRRRRKEGYGAGERGCVVERGLVLRVNIGPYGPPYRYQQKAEYEGATLRKGRQIQGGGAERKCEKGACPSGKESRKKIVEPRRLN